MSNLYLKNMDKALEFLDLAEEKGIEKEYVKAANWQNIVIYRNFGYVRTKKFQECLFQNIFDLQKRLPARKFSRNVKSVMDRTIKRFSLR